MGNDVQAASAAVELLENYKVQAVIGPQKSSEAVFVSNLGNKTQVPIVSFTATSPSLTSNGMPYFVRTTLNDSAQVNSIASLIKAYGWREVVLVYEDTDYGRGILPYLIDALEEIDAHVPYRSVIPFSATSERIKEELYKLMTMQTRVFVVHMSSTMTSHLFTKAKEVGMMNKGFVWIITNGVANIIDSLNPHVIEAMNGVIGVRFHAPKSKELDKLSIRWNRMYQRDNPDESPFNKLSIVGLWGYDTIWALAQAAEKVGISSANNRKPTSRKNSTCLESMVTSTNGPELLTAIVQNKFRGESTEIPRGWEIPTNGKKLRVGVHASGYPEFVKTIKDPVTNATMASGLSIDIFEEAVKRLPFAITYDYLAFDTADAASAWSYNDFVYQVYLQNYDIAVGDITVRYNRTLYVDFTIPYTESGVAMIVPVKENKNKNMWIFLKPLSSGMCYTASFASMLTVQQLSPTVNNVHELQKQGEYVGFHRGSFIEGLLGDIGFDRSKIRPFDTSDEFHSALSKGSKNGGVAAIVHEVPYIKLFLAKYCKGYTMVGPIYKSAGFAFALPKRSPLLTDISRAILNITEGDVIIQIENKWIGQISCQNDDKVDGSGSITFGSFGGLFLLTGVVTTCSLIVALLTNHHKTKQLKPGTKGDEQNQHRHGQQRENGHVQEDQKNEDSENCNEISDNCPQNSKLTPLTYRGEKASRSLSSPSVL
ncbi:hypothetical protein GUJ93_ZPchr0009g1555 [Zizania palustris]|uniref:Ionotropic glutamate receptor C-terminal domain-containing protein n=1 Tax=Zizania palustris TaxID=103762 RepID=A0A8J5V3E5_ZIZPA|nr:hypothetical protein GUJ93_ZPchr0009g1555 [Zizania palustris]